MCENENKKLAPELNDGDLEQVAGGGDYKEAFLDERAIPPHFVVTCLACGAQFVVNNRKACPTCGNNEVYMGFSFDKPIIN